MSNPARLHHRLRSSFASTGQATLVSSGSSASLQPTSQPEPSSVQPEPSSIFPLSTAGQLELLDQVLAEVEQSFIPGNLAQAIPQTTLQATDQLNSPQVSPALKETEGSLSPDISPVEAAAGLQQIEQEPSPELPVEVESYLQKVEDRQDKLTPEIVIADGTTPISGVNQPLKKPVVVLPITPEQEKEGQKKPLSFSLRWLVEWSRKIIKMFTGRVIYRQEPATQ